MTGEPHSVEPEPSALAIAPGQIIGERYLVGELLGGGGMGVVCAGTHIHLGTPVAIKLIHSELKDDAEAVQRFVNEARATAALKGEHIARVFDVGVLASGEPYLVMEQLEGVSLDQYLQERGRLAQSEAVEIVLQVCEGLAEAHAASLVHRDIKPANLFLAKRADGQFSVKILDFGIAKQRVQRHKPALTNPRKSLGSPWYMSPEQMVTPASVDERADVWSLGVVLFELLTDRLPFDGETVPQVCANVLNNAPARLSDYRAGLATELDEIVLRCLEKERDRRFRSVAELAQALLLLASAPTASEERQSPSYGTLRPLQHDLPDSSRHRQRQAWPLALAVVALCSLLAGGLLQYRDPTLVRRAIAATSVDLPWDPRLSPTADDTTSQPTPEGSGLLQYLHAGRALGERERPNTAAARTHNQITHAQVHRRDDSHDALPAPAQQRIEDRYGL